MLTPRLGMAALQPTLPQAGLAAGLPPAQNSSQQKKPKSIYPGKIGANGLPTGTGGPKPQDLVNQMTYMMNPSTLSGVDFMTQQQPGQQMRVMAALAALRPENRMGRVEDFRRQAMGQGADMVRQQQGTLQGLDPSLLNAVKLGAMNSAQQAGNEFMMQQFDPSQDVNAAMSAAQLLSPEVSSPLLAQYMNWLMSSYGQKLNAPRSPTALEAGLNAAASIIPGLGL